MVISRPLDPILGSDSLLNDISAPSPQGRVEKRGKE